MGRTWQIFGRICLPCGKNLSCHRGTLPSATPSLPEREITEREKSKLLITVTKQTWLLNCTFAIVEVANTTLNKLVSLKEMTRKLNWKTIIFSSQERIAFHQHYSERVKHCKKNVKLFPNNTYKIYLIFIFITEINLKHQIKFS